MKWFKQRIRNWLLESENSVSIAIAKENPYSDIESPDSYTLKVIPAIGGRVIQYYKYDRVKDSSRHATYVINDSQDLGEEIKNIVVHEALRGN